MSQKIIGVVMDLMGYIDKGGVIVYILIFLNVIGFTIILWKFFTLPRKNTIINHIKNKVTNNSSINSQIEYEVKKLESGLTIIKNIATVAPLLGLLGTVIGVYKSFEAITQNGLGDPTIFSNGIGIALITTIAGLIVAIPHQIAYNHFISLIDSIELKAKKEIVSE
ncbi:MAG: MotA/TolQ/ExbB proton channel family protein [Arcobacter sp.]|uniref:MotA/TolQ/ExbB proton channel family protein n=1 Tax=Arcobacter sp. TaxID=1872629 RepID=UPI003D0919B0